MHVYTSVWAICLKQPLRLFLFSRKAATQQRDGVGGISRGRALFYSDRVADASHSPSPPSPPDCHSRQFSSISAPCRPPRRFSTRPLLPPSDNATA